MKKYYMLSLTEADRYFNHHDMEIIPSNVNKEDENIEKESSNSKISITIPTHHIFPDSKQDPILLKNQISDLEKELVSMWGKKEAACIIENIKQAENAIDHSHNLEGMALYANKDFVAVVKFPVELEPEIIVGNYFDVRPIYKAMQQRERYYVMVVSQQNIRLLQARNDILINEFDDENFPFENTDYYTTDPTKLTQDIFQENLVKEYFNVADKFLHYYITENPQPIILAGDIKTISYFHEMMDDDKLVVARLHGSYENVHAQDIVKEAYPLIQEFIEKTQKEFKEKISEGQSAGVVSFDFNEIYQEASAGNARFLYITDNFSLKGKIEDTNLIIENPDSPSPDSRELVLDILEKVQSAGGEIIFMRDELLNEGMVLVKRY